MFDKMKQLMEMQKKAKEVQRTLEAVKIEKSSPGGKIRVVMNGVNKVEALEIDESLLTPAQKTEVEKTLARLLSDAAEDVKKESAAKAMEVMKGMNLPL